MVVRCMPRRCDFLRLRFRQSCLWPKCDACSEGHGGRPETTNPPVCATASTCRAEALHSAASASGGDRAAASSARHQRPR